MLFEEKIPYNRQQFVAKINDIADKLDIDPDWIMAVINSESGFDHTISNRITNATGLIQFMPNTALDLGTSISALKAMSNVQQLNYVYKYFKPYKNYITRFEDLYLITFYPNADGEFAGTLDKPNRWAFPDAVYRSNKLVDMNNDGKLTIADFKKFIYKKIPAQYLKQLKKSRSLVIKFGKRNWIPVAILTIITFIATFYLLTKYAKKSL